MVSTILQPAEQGPKLADDLLVLGLEVLEPPEQRKGMVPLDCGALSPVEHHDAAPEDLDRARIKRVVEDAQVPNYTNRRSIRSSRNGVLSGYD